MKTQKEFEFWEQSSRQTIDFKTIYVDITDDLVAGLLLSQIVYWFLPSKAGESKLSIVNGKTTLVKKRSDWHSEIRISERQYDRAIAILVAKGIVGHEIHKSSFYSGATVPHITLNYDRLCDLLNEQKEAFTKQESSNYTNVNPRITEKSVLETTKQESSNYTNVNPRITEKSIAIDTETTPENTPKTTTEREEKKENLRVSMGDTPDQKISYMNLIPKFSEKLKSKQIDYIQNRNEHFAVNRFKDNQVSPEIALELIDKLIEVKRNYPKDNFYQGICFNLSDLFSYQAKILNAYSMIKGRQSDTVAANKEDKYKDAEKHGFRRAVGK